MFTSGSVMFYVMPFMGSVFLSSVWIPAVYYRSLLDLENTAVLVAYFEGDRTAQWKIISK